MLSVHSTNGARIDSRVSVVSVAPDDVLREWPLAAQDLEAAAHSDPDGVFDVTAQEIEKKILEAEHLAIAVSDDRVLAFMSARRRQRLPRTDLLLDYVEGVILHAEVRRQRLSRHLLREAVGTGADLIALHTQSPPMVHAIERWGECCYPRELEGAALCADLRADLRGAMSAIGREPWDEQTGICEGLYHRRLFLGELPSGLGEIDALFLVALVSPVARTRGLQ